MRKAAVLALVVFLALVLMAAIVPRIVSLDSLKPRIIEVIEEKTGRKVAFSSVRLSLFPGIGVKLSGFSVSGDPGHAGESLLSVPEAEIRMSLLPLFAGKVEFSRFILHRPEVFFRKYKDGTHSATRIASRLARVEKQPPPASGEKVRVALKTVFIEEARLHLFLEGKDGQETRLDIEPFTFRLDGIGQKRNEFEVKTSIRGTVQGDVRLAGSAAHEEGTVADPTQFKLAAKGDVFGQPVEMEGKMSAPEGLTEVDVTVTFPKIDMGKIPGAFPALPAAIRESAPEGIATLQVKVSGNLQAMGFEAEADLTRAGWSVGTGIRKFIDMPCTIIAQGHSFPDLFLVSNAELRFPPLLLIANASMTPSTGVREWAASARIASLAEFAKSRGGELSKWTPVGRLTASGGGRRATASSKDTWTIGLDLGEIGIILPEQGIDLRALNGHVELTPAAVDFQSLAGLMNGQHFSLHGTVTLGSAPTGQISLRMPYLDTDALFPSGENGKPQKEKKDTPPSAGQSAGRSISARGNLKIDAGKIRGLDFKDLAGMGRYEEGTLFLDSLRARMYGGDAGLSGRIRLTAANPDFRLKVSLKGVAAEEILSRKTGLKDFLSGAVFLSGDIGGGSRDFADFTRTAAGSGSIRVTGGRIKGVDLVSTAAGLSGLSSLLTGAGAVSSGGKSGETAFSDLSADFKVSGGKIRTDALRIVSDKIGLNGTAAVGFDRTFDFHGALSLSKEMSERARGSTGKFLTAPSGRVEIPLVMSGPLTSPAVAIDTDALAKGLAGKALEDIFRKFQPGKK